MHNSPLLQQILELISVILYAQLNKMLQVVKSMAQYIKGNVPNAFNVLLELWNG